MIHNGTERNWKIVGLTPDNYVIIENEKEGKRNSHERPSEYWGIDYLTRQERGILRKGLTPSGNDRRAPAQ